jgi:integrase
MSEIGNKGDHRQAVDQLANSVLAKNPRTEAVSNRAARRRQQGQERRELRGFGSIYQPIWRDRKTGETKQSPNWWIAYYNRGKLIREPAKTADGSHSRNRNDAVKLLKKRQGEMTAGKPVGPDLQKTSFNDMVTMLIDDYRANGRKSLARVEDAIAHLRGFFGEYKVVEITGDKVTAYVTHRQKEKAANATINAELAALGRMFTLAMRAGKAAGKPYIAKLALNNTRVGFFQHDQFQAVLKHLPEHYQAVVECAYITGWRMADELFTRQRHHLDLKPGWLRLDPGETKNGEGRQFPLTQRLREVLEKQTERTRALEKAKGVIIPWLFHRDGKQIKGFRKAWLRACRNAGVPGKIPHDFRRTAVRNLERAGVPRSAAMKMVGHKTQSIYQRYAIADEGMLRDAAEKLAQLHAIDQKAKTKKATSE